MIYIDKTSGIPLYKQIYSSIASDILTGVIPSGHRLPSTRKLAQELSVGRNTAEKAYKQLEAEGYITARAGSGFTAEKIPLDFSGGFSADFSAKLQPAVSLRSPHKAGTDSGIMPDACSTRPPAPRKPQSTGRTRSADSDGAVIPTVDSTHAGAVQPVYDFIYGSMDSTVFPYKQWRRCMNDALTKMELEPALHYPARYGQPELQAAIAGYLRRSRNVTCDPEDILITPGQQHSMEILANLFEGDSLRFAMEEPGYDGIREVFAQNGSEIIPVDVERDGISLTSLEKTSADLLYLTPSHQFPTGSVLSVAKRRLLLQWAQDSGTYIIEDDYDSELRYFTDPIPAMQSMDGANMTIYTGTFSKSLAPVMRTAYMILPPELKARYASRYGRYNAFVPTLHQLTLAGFIDEGFYEQHINRLRTLYRKKHTALLRAVDEVFGDKVKITGEGAGIHLLIDVKCGLTQEDLIARAAAAGIRLYPTRALYAVEGNAPQHQLLLGFPLVPESAFIGIMAKLRDAWEM